MARDLHPKAQELLDKHTERLRRAMQENALTYARRDLAPLVSPNHIQTAYNALMPDRRPKWLQFLRRWSSFFAGVLAGVGAQELFNFLSANPDDAGRLLSSLGFMGAAIVLQWIVTR